MAGDGASTTICYPRIEVQRADATVVVHWPLQGGAACAQWLREWLREWLE